LEELNLGVSPRNAKKREKEGRFCVQEVKGIGNLGGESVDAVMQGRDAAVERETA